MSEECQFQLHLIQHTGEKPHKCEFCDYRAISQAMVTQHALRMHEEFRKLSDKVLPTHVCDICGKSFKVSMDIWRAKSKTLRFCSLGQVKSKGPYGLSFRCPVLSLRCLWKIVEEQAMPESPSLHSWCQANLPDLWQKVP